MFSNVEDKEVGRGVSIYVADHLTTRVNQINIGIANKDSIWLEIKSGKNSKVIFGCIYRSPSSTLDDDTKLHTILTNMSTQIAADMIIMGDFNHPEIDWESMTTEKNINHSSQHFIDAIRDTYLYQHVTQPTRYRHGQNPNLLDLILTSSEESVSNLEYHAGIGLSDHLVLSCTLTVEKNRLKEGIPRFNYNKGDYAAINDTLMVIDWSSKFIGMTTEKMWIYFSNELEGQMEKHIPKSVPKKNKRRKIWMTKEVTAKHRRKQRAWKKYKETGNKWDYVRATNEKNELTMMTRNLCRDFEYNLARNMKHNPKAFWRYCKSKMKNRSKLGDLKMADGKLTGDDVTKADLLNSFFVSVFTRENTDIPVLEDKHQIKDSVNISFTTDIIEKKLKELKITKSAGPDGFHPRVLNEISTSIKLPLSIICTQSYDEGRLPSDWKNAHITPIYKKGSKDAPGNYRPVSLTSVIGKMMESVIRDSLVKHMMDNNLFCDQQHGFVPGRSCMTQLLVTLELWTELLDSGASIDVIYLDFKKAFDTVPHQRLLRKLKAYGITGEVLEWVRDFLSGRRQRVVVNGKLSSWADILSGIPQGSVLGPILFVIFINDLPDVVSSTAKIFADDTKLFRAIRITEDHDVLQQDLDNLVEWSNKWQLEFNETKCKSLHLGSSNQRLNYQMNSQLLEDTRNEKDLGVYIDDELKFHDHVSKAVAKASRLLGLIRATFTCLDKVTMPRLFTTMVRPHLEYGNVIWHPRFRRDSTEIEKVQRRATKLIQEIRHLPYDKRLRTLELPSLQHRRRRGDMIQTYKILNGIDRIDRSIFFELSTTSVTRGHTQKIVKKHARLGSRQSVFSQRVVNDWNSLPADVIDSQSVNTFKSRLDRFWRPEQYNLPFAMSAM